MKRLGTLSILLFSTHILAAQVTLSGALSGSYATLTAAFSAINTGGGSGAVTVTITANHTLTDPATLTQTNYTVTVQPSGIRTVSCNFNAALLQLFDADNTMIDGKNTATNKLTISNSNTGVSAAAILLDNDASNNTVKNCILEGSSVGLFDNGVVNIKANSGSTGCDNNTIMGNEIKAAGSNLPRNGICMAGLNSSVLNNNNNISNNNIRDFFTPNTFSVGFFSVRYNYGTQITGNSFYQTATRTGSGASLTNRAIEIDDGFYSTASGGFVISGNFIGGTAPSCGGSAYTINHPTTVAWLEGIYIEGGSAAVNSIQGNTIKNISTSSALGTGGNWQVFTAMDLRGSGSYNVGTTTGNIIGSQTGTGSISITQNFTSGASTHSNCIGSFASGTVNIKNNTIGSITTTMTGTLGWVSFYGIYSSQTNNVTIEANTVGGTTANSIQFAPNASHNASLHGIMLESFSGSILNNTVQNLTSDARVEVNGIMLWNNTAGRTQTCTGNTVKNLSTNSGNGLDVTGILAASTSGGNITYTVNINNNTIMDCSTGAATTGECDLIGIWISPRDGTSADFVNGSVNNNTISNLNSMNTFSTAGLIGIAEVQLYNGSGMTINGNNISNLTSLAPLENYGIGTYVTDFSLLPSATSLTIQSNTIHTMSADFTSTAAKPTGIALIGKNITASRNKIYNLNAPNTTNSGSYIAGIAAFGGTNTGDYSVSNNMVSLGSGVTNDVRIAGFQTDNLNFNSLTVLYNSFLISGAAPGGALQRTNCFDRQTITSSTLRNNIFYNARTGGTGGHFAIANTAAVPATGWSVTASDYNYLVSAQTATIGLWGAASQAFSGWKAISGGDNSSVSKITPVQTIPTNLFVNPGTGDLSVNISNAGEANVVQNIGTPVSVTVDYFNNARSPATPDLGAHEFATVPSCFANAGADATICNGQSTQLNASPPGGISFIWSPATGLNNPNIQDPVASPSATTTYYLTIGFANGCSATDEVVVTVIPSPTASITPGGATTFCEGGSVTLTASGGGTYAWSTGATTAAITASINGTYVVTVTAANGCTATASQAVTVFPLPNALITPSGPTTICAGGSVTLTASGGTSYSWSTGATTAAITVSTSGTYTVTATDANGCSDSESQVVTVHPLPTANITPGGATTFCAGGSVTLTASGGTSYSWSTGATTAAITVSTSGTYTVTATDGNGCTDTESQSVTVNPLPTASITPGGATTFCEGGSVMLTASGGTSYAWSNGATTAAITVSNSGTYIVTATDGNGCTDTESQSVTVNPLPTASITPGGATTFCEGGSVMLTASGGTSYAWSTGATTTAITVSNSGTYTVIVTDANSCTDSESQVVTVNSLPMANITPGGATTFCAGGSVTLTASGGTSYSWSTGATTAAITVSTSGTYTVTVTDANSCTDTESQVVTVHPLPTAGITPSGATTFCAGGSVTLTASGGTSYSWSTGATTAAITVSNSGTYTVTATDANNCTDSESQVVTVHPLPTANISGASSICSGETIMLTASGGVSYLWSTSATTASISVSTTGTYSVTVTDANGCTDDASHVVSATNPLACDDDGDTFTENGGDCNDANAAIFPGATETCNGLDDDCDTQIDEGVLLTFYQDSDGDTYGNAAASTQACSAPAGYVANDDDCDDANSAINPAASEVCNNVDDDCSGSPEAAVNTWTGNGDGINWSQASNWSDGIVPLACQDVVIQAGNTVTVAAGLNAVGKTLDVALGAVLQVDVTATLDVDN